MGEQTDFTRIIAFTDGVFAIAITLLVLGFDVPEGEHDIAGRLLDQWPQLLAYALSFVVVGGRWRDHHRFFRTLKRFDERLVTLNLTYLALIALVPFTTDLIGEHGGDTVAPVTYATVIGLVGLTSWTMVHHTLKHEHVAEELRPATRPHGSRGALYTPAVFFASIPVAFLSANAAELMWILIAFQGRMLGREETASP
jgi:uncharacterized membrane protein